jgi:hypothetical protein
MRAQYALTFLTRSDVGHRMPALTKALVSSSSIRLPIEKGKSNEHV